LDKCETEKHIEDVLVNGAELQECFIETEKHRIGRGGHIVLAIVEIE
jgi:hypothetical protein